MPLTSSLYVPGSLADSENVIVDVGTGFFVEKVRWRELETCEVGKSADSHTVEG